MSEMPGIEVPAVPPGSPVRILMMDADAGPARAYDLATGQQVDLTDGTRRCAFVSRFDCHCDSPAQCPVLREHPQEAAAELAARRAAEVVPPDPVFLQPAGREQAGGDPPPPPARPLAPSGRPQLIHSGNYALYLTPEGAYHLAYQRTAGTHPDTGEVLAIDGAPTVHMRDLPERAADMVMALMDRDAPLPPMLESFIFSGAKPNLRAMLAAVKSGAIDDLMGGGSDG